MTLGDKAETALQWVRSGRPLVYDTETSGLDWKRVHPVGYVFSISGNESLYIPIRHGGGGNLAGGRPLESPSGPFEVHPFEIALRKAFADRERLYGAAPQGLTIGHNLKFDYHFSLNAGVRVNNNLWCTQYAAALLDEHARSHSLENSCAVRQLPAKKGEAMYLYLSQKFNLPYSKDLMQHYWRLPGDDVMGVEYAEGDGISTWHLWRDQVPRVMEEGLDVVMQLECDLIRHIVAMERRGVKIDIARLDELEEIFKGKMNEAMRALPPGLNIRSSTQMENYFRTNGISNWPKTELGNPSFPEKWLKTTDAGLKIVAARQVRTILDQFITPMKGTAEREAHVFNGRVHTSLNQLRGDGFGVISGRFSCSFPNLQQVPKHNHELAELYRSLFVADDGYDFYEADYSQCEPRLFAHYARCPALVDGYNANPPVDMHDVTAKMMNADRDTIAKRMNMGLLTGMWPKTLAAHMNWTEHKARSMWAEWFSIYPEIRDFQDTATAAMKNRGYVRTLLGRRCRLEDPKFAYQATSRIIQGGNADILKWKLRDACVLAEQMGDDLHVLLTVHDSLEWQAVSGPRGEACSSEIVRVCSDVQGPPFLLRVPFKMDVKRGKDWARATFGKKLKLGEAA